MITATVKQSNNCWFPLHRPKHNSFPLAGSTAFWRALSNKVNASAQPLLCTHQPFWNTSRPRYLNWPETLARISKWNGSHLAICSLLFEETKNSTLSSRLRSPGVALSRTSTSLSSINQPSQRKQHFKSTVGSFLGCTELWAQADITPYPLCVPAYWYSYISAGQTVASNIHLHILIILASMTMGFALIRSSWQGACLFVLAKWLSRNLFEPRTKS